jgi:hypothetical protein
MTYAAQLSITANTALDTAAICYRKARRDCYRIHALVTHPRTVEAAKIAVWTLYLGAVIAYALGQSARILFQSWVDATVESCLATPDPVEPAAIEDEAQPAPANPDQWLIDLADEAAQRPDPTQADWQAFLTTMNTANLRKHCTESGIRWKDARGKNRHLTKAQMIAAIAAQLDPGATAA